MKTSNPKSFAWGPVVFTYVEEKTNAKGKTVLPAYFCRCPCSETTHKNLINPATSCTRRRSFNPSKDGSESQIINHLKAWILAKDKVSTRMAHLKYEPSNDELTKASQFDWGSPASDSKKAAKQPTAAKKRRAKQER